MNRAKICYLIHENGTFQGGEPSDGNDIFEMVTVGSHSIALHAVNLMQADSDSGGESGDMASDCYLGFSDVISGPKCYTSTDFAATRFVVIH